MLEEMGKRPVTNVTSMDRWVASLERENVFFSCPLDIDFAMLEAFPDAYHAATDGTGPRFPNQKKEAEKYQARFHSAGSRC